MTRAYLRLDPMLVERLSGYPDGPYRAYIDALCLAEAQPERGRFRSLRYLKALLDRAGRHVQYLVDHGDVVLLDNGRVYIDGWDEWQEGDWKVAERVSRIRAKRETGKSRPTPRTVDVTVDVTPDVTVENVPPPRDALLDSGAERSGAMSGAVQDGPDAFETYQRLTMRQAKGGAAQWIGRLLDKYPEHVVERGIIEAHRQDADPSTLLGRVEALLDQRAIRQEKRAERARKDRHVVEMEEARKRAENASPEERAAAEKRAADIRAWAQGLGG